MIGTFLVCSNAHYILYMYSFQSVDTLQQNGSQISLSLGSRRSRDQL